MSKNKKATFGIGFMNLLTLIFILLKVTHVISWSWWLVLAPTLLGVGIALVLLIIFVLGATALLGLLGAILVKEYKEDK